MSLRPWKDAILARLRDGGDGFPGFGQEQVFELSVPDELDLDRLGDLRVRPYVAVWFGQRVDGGPGFAGFCGVRNNAHMANFLALTAGPSGTITGQAVDLVSDLLLGFKPADQGELHETGAPSIRRPLDMSGVRSRNAVPIAYSGTVDL